MHQDVAVTPRSADQIIAELGNRIKKEVVKVLIRILSEKAMTTQELIIALRTRQDLDLSGETDQQLMAHMFMLRYYGLTSYEDGRRFIKGTMADPFVNDVVYSKIKLPSDDPQKKKISSGRPLRSIMYEILTDESLRTKRLTTRVQYHPDYDGSYGTRKALLLAVNNALQEENNRHLFEKKDDAAAFALWGVVPNSAPPHKIARPQHEALYRLMRSKAVIAGWSYEELIPALRQPGSGYKVRVRDSFISLKGKISTIFSKDAGECFQRISWHATVRWRAKWVGGLKTPESPAEFNSVVGSIVSDLGSSLTFESLLENVRIHGCLFGWDCIALPQVFLERQVLAAAGRVVGKSQRVDISQYDFDQAIEDIIDRNQAEQESKLAYARLVQIDPLLGDAGVDELLLTLDLPEEETDDGLAGLTIVDHKP